MMHGQAKIKTANIVAKTIISFCPTCCGPSKDYFKHFHNPNLNSSEYYYITISLKRNIWNFKSIRYNLKILIAPSIMLLNQIICTVLSIQNFIRITNGKRLFKRFISNGVDNIKVVLKEIFCVFKI